MCFCSFFVFVVVKVGGGGSIIYNLLSLFALFVYSPSHLWGGRKFLEGRETGKGGEGDIATKCPTPRWLGLAAYISVSDHPRHPLPWNLDVPSLLGPPWI